MSTKNQEEEKLIDLSARSKLKLANASKSEMEQNIKLFKELNNSIELDIKAYNYELNTRIEEIQKKRENDRKNSYMLIIGLGAMCLLSLMILTFNSNKVEVFAQTSWAVVYHDSNNSIKDQDKEIEESNLNKVENKSDVQKIELTPNFTQMIPISYGPVESAYHNELLTLKDEIVAKDILTGQEFSLEQLSGKKLLISYKENDKDVYFLGQYSKDCNWDGYCVTNAYNSDGTLFGICEYNFDDGVSLECKSIYNSQIDGEWIYVDRQYLEGEAYGKSIRYSLNFEESKNFDDAHVDVSDILYIDSFLNEIDTIMLSYYKGKISNGLYNDKSGEAYLITYFEPNTIENITEPVIKTLYKGKFVDGKFFEENYDSWYITRNIDTTYMYYKGGFLDGNIQHKDKTKEVFENYLTHEKIDEYLDRDGLSEYSKQFVTEYENKDD